MKPSVARSRHNQPLTAPSATSVSPSVAWPEAMPTSVMVTLRPISRATPASTAESGTRPLPNVTTKPLPRRAGGRMLPDGPATAALRPPARSACPTHARVAGLPAELAGSALRAVKAGHARGGVRSAGGDSASRQHTAESLAQEQLGMPGWIVRERADDREAVPLIERRSLEGVRIQRKLHTAASSCLRLSCLQQPAADAPPAHVLAHPERSDPASPAQLQPYTPATSWPWLSVSTVSSWQKSRMPVASTLNSLISSSKRRTVARSASLETLLLRSSVITVALSLSVQRHGRIDLARDDQPAARRAALNPEPRCSFEARAAVRRASRGVLGWTRREVQLMQPACSAALVGVDDALVCALRSPPHG